MKSVEIHEAGMYNVTVSEAERQEGILICIPRLAFDENGEKVFRMKISMDAKSKSDLKNNRHPIEGHPNCYIGDCDDCHDMSCAIHLGYEDFPRMAR